MAFFQAEVVKLRSRNFSMEDINVINRRNAELVAQLRSIDSAFSLGESGNGKIHCLSVSLNVCPSTRPCICQSVRPSASIHQPVCQSVQEPYLDLPSCLFKRPSVYVCLCLLLCTTPKSF